MAKDNALAKALYESWTKIEVAFLTQKLPELYGFNIGLPQLEVLFAINHYGNKETSIKDLTKLTHKTSSAITQTVNKLEQDGLVLRTHSAKDKRVVVVHFTNRGKQEFQNFYENMIKSISEFTSSLSPEDMHEYIRLNNIVADKIMRQYPNKL